MSMYHLWITLLAAAQPRVRRKQKVMFIAPQEASSPARGVKWEQGWKPSGSVQHATNLNDPSLQSITSSLAPSVLYIEPTIKRIKYRSATGKCDPKIPLPTTWYLQERRSKTTLHLKWITLPGAPILFLFYRNNDERTFLFYLCFLALSSFLHCKEKKEETLLYKIRSKVYKCDSHNEVIIFHTKADT